MQYKTIVLEVLRQHPRIYEKLRSDRLLLPTVNLFAQRLKTSHEAWKDLLSQVTPVRNPRQVSGQAMEYALLALEGYLEADFPPEEVKPFPSEVPQPFVLFRAPRG